MKTIATRQGNHAKHTFPIYGAIFEDLLAHFGSIAHAA
jgi:hypothetical protein